MDRPQPGAFLRCQEDAGIPKPLVGESDVHRLQAEEELRFKSCHENSSVEQNSVGVRVRLTSHRLLWCVDGQHWAARLDEFAEATYEHRFFHSPCIELTPSAAVSGGFRLSLKLKDKSVAEELHRQVQAAIKAAAWRQGSFDAVVVGGLAKLRQQHKVQIQATGEELDLALTDLSALREHAKQTVAAVRKVAAAHASSESGKAETSAGIGGLLEEFGLLNNDGSAVSLSGGQLPADISADVANVCKHALNKRGALGMLLAHDVFCLVNRARGTSLVSPEEVMTALRHASAPGGPLRLRTLDKTNAYAVSLASASDADADAQLLAAAERGPISAFDLSAELGLNVAEAQYLLRDAEVRAVLVRDDAPEDVFYYRNCFAEY